MLALHPGSWYGEHMGIIRCLVSNLISFAVLSGAVEALNRKRQTATDKEGSNKGHPKDSGTKEEI